MIPTDTKTHLRLVLRRSGILPAKPRAGCPALPTPAIGTSGEWINRNEFLAAAEAAHAAGYGLAALLAFRQHAIWSPAAPLPAWITRSISNGIGCWLEGTADSLTDALGASLSNRKLRESTMRAREYGGQMFLDAQREIKAGATVDAGLWERIGAPYGLASRTVERTVRALAKQSGLTLSKRQKGRAL